MEEAELFQFIFETREIQKECLAVISELKLISLTEIKTKYLNTKELVETGIQLEQQMIDSKAYKAEIEKVTKEALETQQKD